MGNFLKIIFFMTVSILLLSCNDSTTEVTLTTYSITGSVTDSDGNPLDDVNVYFVYHFNEVPAIKVSKILSQDTVYQNYPNPFSDSTNIRFETYRGSHYEIKLSDYYYSFSSILLQGSSNAGVVDTSLTNFDEYPNGIYRIIIRYIRNSTTRFNSEIYAFINRTQFDQLLHSTPNIKAVNGKFEVNIPELQLEKIINCTNETDSTHAVPKQISNVITFVLMKEGYKSLEVNNSIDRYNRNEFSFVMEKE